MLQGSHERQALLLEKGTNYSPSHPNFTCLWCYPSLQILWSKIYHLGKISSIHSAQVADWLLQPLLMKDVVIESPNGMKIITNKFQCINMKSEWVLIKKTQNPMHILGTTSPARILPYLVPRTLNNPADSCYYLHQFLWNLSLFVIM